jgi:hypothetical protein
MNKIKDLRKIDDSFLIEICNLFNVSTNIFKNSVNNVTVYINSQTKREISILCDKTNKMRSYFNTKTKHFSHKVNDQWCEDVIKKYFNIKYII